MYPSGTNNANCESESDPEILGYAYFGSDLEDGAHQHGASDTKHFSSEVSILEHAPANGVFSLKKFKCNI